ncbi:MAG: formimidoylglutamate deiminase [Marinicaulis sp.]|nr:formimidoylglutamate deiminase [Marinicaulis sp.]
MTILKAKNALLETGWAKNVEIEIGGEGRIAAITTNATPAAASSQNLLPSPANLHSHAFQRAMAGLTEARGPTGQDSFWTWRKLMYQFLDQLGPDDIQSITAFAQMEMLEAGYASVVEFHYLHHGAGGAPYDDKAELAKRVIAASSETGIGLTLAPVLYERGGCDNRALDGGQKRFAHDLETFGELITATRANLPVLGDDALVGVAAHSLRAVRPESLGGLIEIADGAPVHIHIAEQMAEVEEVKTAYGKRPVEWLIDNQKIDEQWCLVHATQMEPHETNALAKSGAVAGICPVTEANLGDGIFDGANFFGDGGRFGVGTDSNVNISLTEELRLFEYSQRLRGRARAILATEEKSTGRTLFEGAAKGGAQAAGRDSGAIAVGKIADLIALDGASVHLDGRAGDAILDSFIFAGDDALVTDVWSAGRHVVKTGRHIAHDALEARYRECVKALRDRI